MTGCQCQHDRTCLVMKNKNDSVIYYEWYVVIGQDRYRRRQLIAASRTWIAVADTPVTTSWNRACNHQVSIYTKTHFTIFSGFILQQLNQKSSSTKLLLPLSLSLSLSLFHISATFVTFLLAGEGLYCNEDDLVDSQSSSPVTSTLPFFPPFFSSPLYGRFSLHRSLYGKHQPQKKPQTKKKHMTPAIFFSVLSVLFCHSVCILFRGVSIFITWSCVVNASGERLSRKYHRNNRKRPRCSLLIFLYISHFFSNTTQKKMLRSLTGDDGSKYAAVE